MEKVWGGKMQKINLRQTCSLSVFLSVSRIFLHFFTKESVKNAWQQPEGSSNVGLKVDVVDIIFIRSGQKTKNVF